MEVFVYDDASTDGTVSRINHHPISAHPAFGLYSSQVNAGGPAAGRQHIADRATTDFLTFVDGDDLVDPDQLAKLMPLLTDNIDMIITPYTLRGKSEDLKKDRGFIQVDSTSIIRLISGIGGRIYRTTYAKRNICHEFIGRSEDARLNMKILLDGEANIFHEPDICFYRIDKSRKSLLAEQILPEEVRHRVDLFRDLQKKYDLNDRYIYAVRLNLINAINSDSTNTKECVKQKIDALNEIIPIYLKRIVFLCADLSRVGGVSTRITTLLNGPDKEKYFAIGLRNANGLEHPSYKSIEHDHEEILTLSKEWNAYDTVVVTQNNNLRLFPDNFRTIIRRLPLVYFGDAQLAFLMQHGGILDREKENNRFLVSKIVSLSKGDLALQRQFGVTGQVVLPLPTKQRDNYEFLYNRLPRCGYVGVCDFKAKATDRLLDIAEFIGENGLPPLQVYTSDGGNSPDYAAFVAMVSDRGLQDHVLISTGVRDKESIYPNFDCLLVPSKQESFGLSILEAYSYGKPVIASSEAPGPAEIVEHGVTGFLIDGFDPSDVGRHLIEGTKDSWEKLSSNAFLRHKDYTPEGFSNALQSVCQDVIQKYDGKNRVRPFPIIPVKGGVDPEGYKRQRAYLKNREDLITSLRGANVRLKRTNASLKNSNVELHEKNADLKSTISKNHEEIKKRDERITALRVAYARLKQTNASLKNSNVELHEKNVDLKSTISKKYEAIKKRDERITALRKAYARLKQTNASLKNSNVELHKTKADLKSTISKNYEAIKRRGQTMKKLKESLKRERERRHLLEAQGRRQKEESV